MMSNAEWWDMMGEGNATIKIEPGSSDSEDHKILLQNGEVSVELNINNFLDRQPVNVKAEPGNVKAEPGNVMAQAGNVIAQAEDVSLANHAASTVDRLRNFQVEGALQEQALEQRKLPPNWEEIPIPTDMLSASMSPMRVTKVTTTASSRFEDLFRYPLDLIHEGGLKEAREYGTAERRWIIAEVQDRSMFNSLITNRDLWPNTAIQDLIREHFVFQQYDKGSPNGSAFISLYEIDCEKLPYVALIDPRTGENLYLFGGNGQPIDTLQFAAYLRAFLEVNGPVSGFDSPRPVTSRLLQQYREMEDQMQKAIRASLESERQARRHRLGPRLGYNPEGH